MKKLLPALLTGLFFLPWVISAQICIPDTTIKKPGIYPSGGILDTVWINEFYTETITYYSIKDTTITVTINPYPSASVKARLDSVNIDNSKDNSSLNIPNGLYLTCTSPTCGLPGNARSCVKLDGTITNISDTGSYLVHLSVDYHFTILTAPLTGINYSLNGNVYPFTLVVKQRKQQSTRTDEVRNSHVQVSINPQNSGIQISGISNSYPCTVKVFNTSGQELLRHYSIPNNGIIQLNSSLRSGLYYVTVEQEKDSFPVQTVLIP